MQMTKNNVLPAITILSTQKRISCGISLIASTNGQTVILDFLQIEIPSVNNVNDKLCPIVMPHQSHHLNC